MAGKFKLQTTNATSRTSSNKSIEFISWTPYPQVTNKKTELVNRIGAKETIVQTLFESSTPTRGQAIAYLPNSNITAIRELQDTINSMVGVDLKLTDSINNGTYEKLVITDLNTQIKKVNSDSSWLLICEFTQFLRVQ
jgi:hypothetical protein